MNISIVEVIQLAILRDPVVKRNDGRATLDEAGSGLGVLDELELGVCDADGLGKSRRVDVGLLEQHDELTVRDQSCRNIVLQ